MSLNTNSMFNVDRGVGKQGVSSIFGNVKASFTTAWLGLAMVSFASMRHAVESTQKTRNLNVLVYWSTILLFVCCCYLLLKDDSSISISDYRLKGSMTGMIDPSKNEVYYS